MLVCTSPKRCGPSDETILDSVMGWCGIRATADDETGFKLLSGINAPLPQQAVLFIRLTQLILGAPAVPIIPIFKELRLGREAGVVPAVSSSVSS